MNAKEFYRACEHFDWHYEMSDDHRVWMAGEAAKTRLLAQAPFGSENRRIYDAWCAHVFSGPPWGTPKAPRPTEPEEIEGGTK